MIDIAEQICLAVDEIVKEKLKSINFDTTIIATIEDDSSSKDYKYTCSNGSTQFIAFSKDTAYKKGDTVQVTIPNNDYDQQKIIIGKYVAKDATPFVFMLPFETFIDVSANIIDKDVNTNALSLRANDSILDAEGKKKENFMEECLMYSNFFQEGYKGYNRLGIKGQFQSWLTALEPVVGNYGYHLEVFSFTDNLLQENVLPNLCTLYSDLLNNKPVDYWESVLNKIPENWFIDLGAILDQQYTKDAFIEAFRGTTTRSNRSTMIKGLLHTKLTVTHMYLNSEEMYGNPYNFQSYFEQERVFDVSQLGTIIGVNLYFYQESGSFLDKNGELIPYQFEDMETLRPFNLFTKDPYICLGYDLAEFDKEQAILYSTDGETFLIEDNTPVENNYKNIRLRWLHEFADETIRVVNETSKLEKDYEIRWYQYTMGSPSADEYSGVYWQKIPDAIRDDNGIEYIDKKEIGPEQSYVTADSKFNCILRPRTNKEVEKIKVIILYDNKVIESNILTFSNQHKDGVSSAATAKTVAGLSLWCQDDSYGNYFVYGQNNKILENDKLSKNTILTLEAKFADASLLTSEYNVDQLAPPLKEAKWITWEFPLTNTMIEVEGFDYRTKQKKPGFFNDAEVEVKNGIIYITRYGNPSSGHAINNEQNYFIKDFYSVSYTNNTVKCTISKDRMIYTATKDMQFGLRGTSGAEATLVLNFDNNKTALTACKSNESLRVTAHLYDSTYKEIDFNDEAFGLTCDWSWAVYHQKFKSTDLFDPKVDDDPEKNDLRYYTLQYLKEEYDAEIAKLQPEEPVSEQAAYFASLIKILEDKNSSSEIPEDELGIFKNLKPKIQARYAQDFGDIKIELIPDSKNSCTISHKNTLDINELEYMQVLQVTVKNWLESREDDYTNQEKPPEKPPAPFNANMIAYLPIPIRKDERFRNIIGPTEIVYDSNGGISYNKIEYELWGRESLDEIDRENDVCIEDEAAGLKLNQSIAFRNHSAWDIYNPYGEKSDLIGSFKKKSQPKPEDDPIQVSNILRPAPIYTEDAAPYGVCCKLDLTTQGDIETVWIQPLVIMQNRYPSATLNKWDGQSIKMNENEGYIIAPAIAAGKKNSDNTFSGVMLGDWSKTDTEKSLTKMTGLWGFHHGAQVFGFKENGTAFIGKSGHGRIEFDGNNGVIKSSLWDTLKDGMMLDLDDGILDLQKNSRYELIELDKDSYEKDKYYILQTGYFPVPIDKPWDADKDYYLLKLVDLGRITLYTFTTKRDNNEKQYFYQKDITYNEVSSYDKEKDRYFVDGFVKVTINKNQYDAAYSQGESRKYYTLKEEFAPSSEEYKKDTVYYTEYGKVSLISESLYNIYYIEEKDDKGNKISRSTKYYVEKDGAYQLSEEPYKEGTSYWIKEFTAVDSNNITKEEYDKFLKDGTSTKYFIKTGSIHSLSKGDYSAGIPYYMPDKIEKKFSEESFNQYKEADNKIYELASETYSVVAKDAEFSETKIYAEYAYMQCYFNSKGPSEDEKWNTSEDPNIIDGIKYPGPYSEDDQTNRTRQYHTFSDGYQLSNDEYDSTEKYYQYLENKDSRYITLSAAEARFPLAIGTTNIISNRKFRVEWDGTVWIENGNIQGIIKAEELYCEYGFIGGWEIDSDSLTGGKTILHSSDGIFTNRVGIIDQISSKSGDGLLGEIGLIYGSTGKDVTYNIGIISKNQSIVLDTMQATGSTSNIALRSQTGVWAQCSNFYVMGNDGNWQSNANSVELFCKNFEVIKSDTITLKAGKIEFGKSGGTVEIGSDKLTISSTYLTVTTLKGNQEGIYARFA